MWADTLLAAERTHLLQLALWAMASVVAGTALFLVPAMRRQSSPLLRQFAIQWTGWGVAELLVVWASRTGLDLRDLAAARQLERFLWLSCGLELGVIAVGMTLSIMSWVVGRRAAGVGAGIGVATQGAALLILDLPFAMALGGVV